MNTHNRPGESPVSNLIRTLLSLPELKLRAAWLMNHVQQLTPQESAPLLDALCKSSERGQPAAKEALVAWVVGLVQVGDCDWVILLRQASLEQGLLSLNRLLRPIAPAVASADTVPPVPDYGAGRELTVGERRSLARRPNRRAFDRLLADPHPLVIQILLHNPHLTEDDVVRLVSRRPLRQGVICELAQCPDWLVRPRVRMTLLHNPGTPGPVALPLLALCKRDELLEVLENAALNAVLRTTARELLDRRPPLGAVPNPTLQ
jgi:hypothetical protein